MPKASVQNIALVLAGGSGERFGSPTPKQFLPMCGMPLMCHCLTSLQECPLIDEIYIVGKKGTLEQTEKLIHDYHLAKAKAVIEGGDTRKKSAYRGLCYLRKLKLEPDAIVLICDADRPNLPQSMIEENILAAREYGAAVTAINATDSIFYSRSGALVNEYMPRRMVYQAQTPQTFRFGIIYKAHRKAAMSPKYDLYTDDASLVSAIMHVHVAIVAGSKENIKINTPQEEAIFASIRRNAHE